MNFQMFKLVLQGRGTTDQIANICWIIEKVREFQKKSVSALLTMPKSLTVWITINCGKFWRRWEYQTTWPASWKTCLQDRKQQNWTWNNRLVPDRKRSPSRLYMSPCLFNLYAEYIMRNAGLEKAQAGIKIAGRNINNLRCRWYHPYGRK